MAKNTEQKYVWLPTLKVWAAATSSESPPCQSAKKRKSEHQGQKTDTKRSKNDASTCPICLENHELVLLRFCMHSFCAECISKWSKLQRKCPLCKQRFDGWISDIQSNQIFKEHILLPLKSSSYKSNSVIHRPREIHSPVRGELAEPLPRRRHFGDTRGPVRGELAEDPNRTKPLPRRRHFGNSRFVSPYENRRLEEERAAEKVIRWRASIYNKGLKAIPHRLQRTKPQSVKFNLNERARVQRRIEPWVQRELNAVLGDGDHMLLVHFVVSLWLSRLEKKDNQQETTHADIEDEFINQMKPFLGDKASLFWHELRCFDESPFTMHTYDSVVEYRRPYVERAVLTGSVRWNDVDRAGSSRQTNSTWAGQ